MRKKKHGNERLSTLSAIVCRNGADFGRDPASLFADGKLLRLEIGCGKGGFIRGISKAEPEYNYIAMEKVADVVVLAAERYSEDRGLGSLDSQGRWVDADGNAYAGGEVYDIPMEKRGNVRFVVGDAADLTEIFPEGCFESIYLNFSDPWEKKGYASRRLTHPDFLKKYLYLLKDGGMLKFKTDNVKLFDFSEETIPATGFEVTFLTRDLHASEKAATNVVTEYEKNFSDRGVKINCIEARKVASAADFAVNEE